MKQQQLFKSLDDSTKFLLASYSPLEHVSASAIQCFQDCGKKWFDKYVLKERDPGSEATDLGGEIHDLLERFVKDGDVIDSSILAGKIAIGAIPHIPSPRTAGVGCEVSLDDLPLREACALPFKGFIDLLDTRAAGTIIITDYKTSSNAKKYAKTADELRDNIQLNIYAKHVIDNYDCEKVVLRHIYLQTRGGSYTSVVETTMTREDINIFFDKNIRPIIQEMKEASLDKATDQKKNFDSCHSFGVTCASISSCKNPNRNVVLSPEMESLLKSLNIPSNQ